MRRLLAVVLVASLLAPAASAGMTITQPNYSSGDWFEYDGWTAAVFAEYEAQMAAESSDFEYLNLSGEGRFVFALGGFLDVSGDLFFVGVLVWEVVELAGEVGLVEVFVTA